MEKSYFPGYNTCNACNQPIAVKDVRSHLLKCRGRSLILSTIETKLCVFCHKQIPINELQDHIDICDEQQIISHNSPSLPKKIFTNSDKSFDDSSPHHLARNDDQHNDQDDDTGYQTPTAEIPPVTIIFNNILYQNNIFITFYRSTQNFALNRLVQRKKKEKCVPYVIKHSIK
jgi:hypothetical protein